jgi:hypothetical protein
VAVVACVRHYRHIGTFVGELKEIGIGYGILGIIVLAYLYLYPHKALTVVDMNGNLDAGREAELCAGDGYTPIPFRLFGQLRAGGTASVRCNVYRS